ncbi:beta-glucosidase BglX [Halobacillus salinarum]|uniref:beta-glucosidase n=1 Tax=Halobacillus salinarum TaxID=2932257 RepID=A0ABY4EIS9_9BACI|nr:beta-glucosidase BglX [Halobacillus salinarum]UOQ43996.1 beta-glucosidase BglX [Halobacillus salinarum]
MRDDFLKQLLERMTLDEKIGQLLQLATPFFKGSSSEGQITGPLEGMGITEETAQHAGSVLGASGAGEIMNIQKRHLEDNRLGIPLLMMSDVVHGYKTIFPVPLAIGCSWDLDLARQSAEIAAREAAVSGIHVTFAPMVDLVRDPRWGRVMETTGEDTYLNGEFAKVQVEGFQGENLSSSLEHVAACVKHFAAYGAVEGGRDYNTVDMSERQLREVYLPAYKAALDAGCEMVMTAFTTVNGIPATGNKELMNDLLRKEWGFEGVVISDWGAVKELIPHGVAADESAAALKAITSSVDIEMMTACYNDHLKELVENGSVQESLIDQSVMRILELKEKLGLFDNPYRGADEEKERELVFSKAHREVARRLAGKSSVLLKNDGILPLNKKQKIALIGPFANNNDVLGPWSWLGSKEDAVTMRQGFLSKVSSDQLIIAEGSGIEAMEEKELQEALEAAEEADILVLALGEKSEMSGEAGSRTNIKLPDAQLKLLEKLARTGKPVVSVLFNGRPLDLTEVKKASDAILEAWYPGSEAGQAVADLLFGDVNPSGKLSMSFPANAGQIPVYYNNYNTGRPKDAPDAQERFVSQYLDSENEPLYPFGFGLSYTSFSYDDIQISSSAMTGNETIQLSVKVTNTGKRFGEEIVQLYVQDLVGEVIRPLKELKGFKRIALDPGVSETVTFELTEEQLRYHHSNLEYASDQGDFIAYIGSNSRDVTGVKFQLI